MQRQTEKQSLKKQNTQPQKQSDIKKNDVNESDDEKKHIFLENVKIHFLFVLILFVFFFWKKWIGILNDAENFCTSNDDVKRIEDVKKKLEDAEFFKNKFVRMVYSPQIVLFCQELGIFTAMCSYVCEYIGVEIIYE